MGKEGGRMIERFRLWLRDWLFPEYAALNTKVGVLSKSVDRLHTAVRKQKGRA